MRTEPTEREVPRSNWIHCPSPFADQRVARLLSTVFWGRLPSWVLALTAAPVGGISCAWAAPAMKRATTADPTRLLETPLMVFLCLLRGQMPARRFEAVRTGTAGKLI